MGTGSAHYGVRRRTVYGFILAYCRENGGNFPTIRVIQDACKFPSTDTVTYHLDLLERDKKLERRNGRWCVVGARWLPPGEEAPCPPAHLPS